MTVLPPARRRRVVIIGGGVSGAATAWNLARSGCDAEIIVIEPRADLGRGLAYSATDTAHRINVPAAKMSIDPDLPSHFLDWLASPSGPMLDPASVARNGDLFPPRAVFGAYMADSLKPDLDCGAIRHLRQTARGVTQDMSGKGYNILLSDQSELQADLVVLTVSHPVPDLPAELRHLKGSDRIIADPYDTQRLLAIGATERVLIVGSGLTSADVIATLERRGFWGHIHAISRRGHRSQGHGPVIDACETDFAASARNGAVALVAHVRDAVRQDAARGQGWQAVFDRLRADGPAIWANLDQPSRARFLRHLRSLWDVHRFRIAPQVQQVLDGWVTRGILQFQAARLVRCVETGNAITVTLRPRGHAETETRVFDRIVITTGPAHGSVIATNDALGSLAQGGLIRPDSLGLGLAVTDQCRALGSDGTVSPGLFVAGPLARENVGELMGLPEVTRHAQRVAETIVASLQTGFASVPNVFAARDVTGLPASSVNA